MTDPSVRSDRLAEFVSLLTGADEIDATDATRARTVRTDRPDSLEIVAHAILELRESERAMRVTPYLDHRFEPVIDLRSGADDDLGPTDQRFRRHIGGRSTGTPPSGFVSA